MLNSVNLGLSAMVAADGTATMSLKSVANTEYAAVLATFRGAGNPTWTFLVSGQAVGFANGPGVDIGPRLCAPNESVTISVTGGLPGTTVQGQVHGGRSPNLEEAVSYASLLAANQVSVLISNQRQKLYPDGTTIPTNPLTPSFTVAPSSSGGGRFTLPAGTVALRILANSGGLLFDYQFFVGGHQSVEQYFGSLTAPGSPTTVSLPTLPLTIPVETAWDNQVDINVVTPANAGTVQFFISALFQAESPGQAGDSQSVRMIVAAPWQAAQSTLGTQPAALAAGASVTLIAGSGAQQIYVFGLTADCSGAAGGAGFSKISVKGSSAPDSGLGVFLRGQDPETQWTTHCAGAHTLPGDGLVLKNTDTVPHNFSVSLSFGQA